MSQPTRRGILRGTAALGLLATVGSAAEAAATPAEEQPLPATAERKAVMSIGMTETEADCWLATAEAAGKFFELPELHPMDRQEVASAIHIIQNKLLSRPTYRQYRDAVKKAAGGN